MTKDDNTKQEGVEEIPRKWLVIFYKSFRKFKRSICCVTRRILSKECHLKDPLHHPSASVFSMGAQSREHNTLK